MRLNAGILTSKLSETKSFYVENLSFKIKFENEFYLLLKTPNNKDALSFLLPHHPTQQPFFHEPFLGKGMYITIEVENVDELYENIKRKGVEIKVDMRDEPWGERHFAIEDPNGIGIDIVKYTKPLEKN
ncbi:VOC family protein [Aquimarina longa]|uniref:VOC family protein n=1 Tax=Aquimarina longa TaxID=1080221 RepID=UPI0007802C0A|nr:VOC family protein [Aquimarina longa]